MAKSGMKSYVHKHRDPTFDIVLGKFRKEARLAAEQERSMAAFRGLATCRKIISIMEDTESERYRTNRNKK